MKHARLVLLASMALLLTTACNSEYQIANRYLQKFQKQRNTAVERIYVALPQTVLHTNSTLETIRDFDYLTPREQDSLIAATTLLLPAVDDSLFLDQFGHSLLYTLSRVGIPIVVVSDGSRLPKASDSVFTIDILQLEAEEFLQPARSHFTTRKGAYYAYDYNLRHFATNVWLRTNDADSVRPIYFHSDEEQETFRGTVTRLRDNQATMKGHRETLGLDKVYATARRAGNQCAILFVEELLTDQVRRVKGSNEQYFYYDPSCRCILDDVPYNEGKQQGFLTVE
ncbi:MAG: hypothetical protein IJ684_01865 [Bacteroidales bacterium]|nr:hypothetical protein [Bacteroidales bacterium]